MAGGGRRKYFPTQLETFVQCPLKYQCSRDPEIREKYRKPTPQLYVGMCVHDALEVFFDIRKVPVAERTREKLGELLRRAWAGVDLWPKRRRERAEERRRIFGDDREEEAAWGRYALNLLDRYFMICDRAAVPFTSEQFHEAELASGTVLGGKIDRIDKLEDGSLKILDYKTGKPPFRPDDESVAEEDLQLSTYAIIVRKKYRVPVRRCALVFLGHDLEAGFSPTDDLLVEKAARIEEIVRAIEGETEFAPRENNLCPWCEYREICPVGEQLETPEETPDVPF
jgi:putative RecB family exonuclease